MSKILVGKGFKVDVFEKREDPTLGLKFEGRSVNLTLTTRAMKTIKQLGME